MSKENLPGFVALPEVQDYTDQVHVGALGLPVGLDPESLELNVKGLVRSSRLFGFDRTVITGYSGDSTHYSLGAGNLSPDGTSTLSTGVAVEKERLADSNIEEGITTLPPEYNWDTTVLKINNSEINERIRADGDKWARSMVDPKARAFYMNQALRSSLNRAGRDHIITARNLMGLSLMSGADTAINTAVWHLPLVEATLIAPFIWLPANAGSHVYNKFKHKEELPPRMWSNMIFLQLDRMLGGMALTRATRFIRSNV